MPKTKNQPETTEQLSASMTKKQILAVLKTLPLSELSKLMNVFLQSLSRK